jgi:hypothetical protein
VDYAGGRGPDEFRAANTAAIHDLLVRVVAEQANPENQPGFDRVTLFYPARRSWRRSPLQTDLTSMGRSMDHDGGR